jgi:hypothetical protein
MRIQSELISVQMTLAPWHVYGVRICALPEAVLPKYLMLDTGACALYSALRFSWYPPPETFVHLSLPGTWLDYMDRNLQLFLFYSFVGEIFHRSFKTIFRIQCEFLLK